MVKRPDTNTMEGMLWNAHHVLEAALDPSTKGVPKSFFRNARGIVLLSIVEAGFIFSGNTGTGIIMTRDKDGKWSAPSAVGFTGVGYGFLIGASTKDLIIFLMNEDTMKAYSENIHLKLGCEVDVTVGDFGRNADVDFTASRKGAEGAITVAFTHGAFVAAAFEVGTLSPQSLANSQFYGKEVTQHEILFDGAADIPEGTQVPEVHEMLDKLAADGESETTNKKSNEGVKLGVKKAIHTSNE